MLANNLSSLNKFAKSKKIICKNENVRKHHKKDATVDFDTFGRNVSLMWFILQLMFKPILWLAGLKCTLLLKIP